MMVFLPVGLMPAAAGARGWREVPVKACSEAAIGCGLTVELVQPGGVAAGRPALHRLLELCELGGDGLRLLWGADLRDAQRCPCLRGGGGGAAKKPGGGALGRQLQGVASGSGSSRSSVLLQAPCCLYGSAQHRADSEEDGQQGQREDGSGANKRPASQPYRLLARHPNTPAASRHSLRRGGERVRRVEATESHALCVDGSRTMVICLSGGTSSSFSKQQGY